MTAELHPEVLALLAQQGGAGRFPAGMVGDEAAMQEYLQAGRSGIGREGVSAQQEVGAVSEGLLPSGRAFRAYTPTDQAQSMFLYLHGGGWVVGNLDMHDELCRRLAQRAGSVVVSLDYRLAPEHPFPAALDDCFEAVSWMAKNAELGGGGESRLIVGGTSAGGNLAAALALRCRDHPVADIALQVLMYPVLDSRMDSVSYGLFGDGPVLSRSQMEWYWKQYVPQAEQRRDPLASPSWAKDLGGLPPAIIVVPECDPLRDEAEEYAERLHAAGVDVRVLRYAGQVHSFLRYIDVLTDADRAISDVAEAVRELAKPGARRGS